MGIEPQDTVYFIQDNLIHKGVVIEQVPLHVDVDDVLAPYYRVKTHFGLQIRMYHELYHTIDGLVDSIMHESCWS